LSTWRDNTAAEEEDEDCHAGRAGIAAEQGMLVIVAASAGERTNEGLKALGQAPRLLSALAGVCDIMCLRNTRTHAVYSGAVSSGVPTPFPVPPWRIPVVVDAANRLVAIIRSHPAVTSTPDSTSSNDRYSCRCGCGALPSVVCEEGKVVRGSYLRQMTLPYK
jgi:hypothetical protein